MSKFVTFLLFPNAPIGHRYVIHVIDGFSRKVWAYVCRTKEAKGIVGFLERLIMYEWLVVPNEWHSDNGSEFKNSDMTTLVKKWGGKIKHGMPRNPQTQGSVPFFSM